MTSLFFVIICTYDVCVVVIIIIIMTIIIITPAWQMQKLWLPLSDFFKFSGVVNLDSQVPTQEVWLQNPSL